MPAEQHVLTNDSRIYFPIDGECCLIDPQSECAHLKSVYAIETRNAIGCLRSRLQLRVICLNFENKYVLNSLRIVVVNNNNYFLCKRGFSTNQI